MAQAGDGESDVLRAGPLRHPRESVLPARPGGQWAQQAAEPGVTSSSWEPPLHLAERLLLLVLSATARLGVC